MIFGLVSLAIGLTLFDLAFLILVTQGWGGWLVALSQGISFSFGLWRLWHSDRNLVLFLEIAWRKGEPVVPELWEECLIQVGAWALVLPGFLTDLLGVLILMESSRKTIFEGLSRFFSRLGGL